MTTYKPFTKTINDEHGNQMVVCELYGTNECRNIHTPNKGCANCPMIAAMINQLHAFEEIYMQEQTENDGQGK